ncbi:MAG: transglycosylase [Xanthobacteraceae bacterium]|nr:transglycosylase [Xanthobacteraceae bacterium]
MRFDPTTTFFIVLVIGAVLGLVFDRLLGRGWLARKITGGRQYLTSALVGVAGSFIGYHLAIMFKLGAGWPQLLGAAIGALVVLWVWRMAG